MSLFLNHFLLALMLFLFAGLTVTESRSISYQGYTSVSWSQVHPPERGINDSFHISFESERQQFKEFALGDYSLTHKDELNNELGNTIHAMILDRLGRYESLPDYYRKTLDNGVLCEVSRCNASSVKSIQYQSDTLTNEQRKKEIEAAKHANIDINCSNTNSSSFDECFCTENNTLLYCAALKFKRRIEMNRVAKTICEDELFEMIDQKNVPEIHASKIVRMYRKKGVNEALAEKFKAPSVSVHVDWLITDDEGIHSNDAIGFYCMASDPIAYAVVKDLFSANALRWTLETYVIEAVFNGTHTNLDSACKIKNFLKSQVGKCACEGDVGLTFCIFKARANYLKKIGYLICNGDEVKFVNFKYPLTLPPFHCLSDFDAAWSAPECEFYLSSILT